MNASVKNVLVAALLSLLLIGAGCDTAQSTPPHATNVTPPATAQPGTEHTDATDTPALAEEADATKNGLHKVVKVVDGDTVDVDVDGVTERIRLIGINTPETVDPRKPVECFGREASDKAKSILTGQSVRLESDSSQDDRDKYGRLLRYVFLSDGSNFNLTMIIDGYAYEYTYDVPYKYQAEFKSAEKDARAASRGLWSENTCSGSASGSTSKTTEPVPITPSGTPQPPKPSAAPIVPPEQTTCVIKGNISSSHEKIYHVPGCGSYNQTVITESAGERWFCSEAEAVAAGWRKAKNCP